MPWSLLLAHWGTYLEVKKSSEKQIKAAKFHYRELMALTSKTLSTPGFVTPSTVP
jgi:hypothetical protein